MWMSLILLAVILAVCIQWVRVAWRGRLVFSLEGFCTRCGYDLRAVAGRTDRCPECGQPFSETGRSTGLVRRRGKADVAAAVFWTVVVSALLVWASVVVISDLVAR